MKSSPILFFFSLVIALSVFTTKTGLAGPEKDFCEHAKQNLGEINEQLPMRLDSTSELTNITVIRLSNHCFITYRYFLDLRLVYSELKEEFGELLTMNKQDYIQTWNGEKLRQEFSEYLLSQTPRETFEMANVPGVSVKLIYQFAPFSVEPLEVDVK